MQPWWTLVISFKKHLKTFYQPQTLKEMFKSYSAHMHTNTPTFMCKMAEINVIWFEPRVRLLCNLAAVLKVSTVRSQFHHVPNGT